MNRQNLKEAARVANVSVSTVSRALNDKPGLSAATKERVLSVCKELGYQPSVAARQLKVGKSAAIGISLGILDWQLSPYVTYLFEILSELLHRQGLMPNLYRHEEMDRLINECSVAIVLGIEESDPRTAYLEQQGIPFVAIGRQKSGFWVAPDDELGGFLAGDHLISQGCKSLGILGCNTNDSATTLRLAGFKRACESQGLAFQRFIVPVAELIELSTYRHCMAHFQPQLQQLDGLFCMTDQMACAVKHVCEDINIPLGSQLKLVGFDDMPVYSKGITTIRQDLVHIAERVLTLVNDAKNGKKERGLLVPVKLIPRASS